MLKRCEEEGMWQSSADDMFFLQAELAKEAEN